MAVLKRHAFESTRSSELASHLGGAVVLELRDMRTEADRLLREARVESERTLREARAEAARIRAQALEDGRAEGIERGIEDGLTQGRAQGEATAHDEVRASFSERLAALESAWTSAITHWQASREALMREARRGTIALALGIASRIVRRSVEANPELVAAQLEAALELLGKATGVMVQCSQSDRALLGDMLPTIVERLGVAPDVTFVVDESLGAGDIVVRVAEGGVDSSLSTQLDRLAEALLPGREPGHEAIP